MPRRNNRRARAGRPRGSLPMGPDPNEGTYGNYLGLPEPSREYLLELHRRMKELLVYVISIHSLLPSVDRPQLDR